MENHSPKKRIGELITPYFNQTKNPRLWLLFQYFLGGTFDKRKLVTKHFSGQKRILEIGCSSGLVSSVFTQFKNIEFLGMDIDEKAITFAKKDFLSFKILNSDVVVLKSLNMKIKNSTTFYLPRFCTIFQIMKQRKCCRQHPIYYLMKESL